LLDELNEDEKEPVFFIATIWDSREAIDDAAATF